MEIAKLRDYCLITTHPLGRHKARVFATVLGLTAADANELREALLEAARIREFSLGEQDEYGRRLIMDFIMIGPVGQATVRSGWINRTGEEYARLTTCYIL